MNRNARPRANPRLVRKSCESGRRWIGRVERLVRAFDDGTSASAAVRNHIRSLQHRKETLSTKIAAADRRGHDCDDYTLAAVDDAIARVRVAWSTVIRVLDREALLGSV